MEHTPTHTEELLTASAQWIIRGLQLNGYLPYPIKNGKLSFEKPSIFCVAWSFLIVLGALANSYFFLLYFHDFLGEMRNPEAEKLVMKGLLVLMALISICLKIHPLILRKDLARFWSEQCKLVSHFRNVEHSGELLFPIVRLEEKLSSIKTWGRRWCIAAAITGMIMILQPETPRMLDLFRESTTTGIEGTIVILTLTANHVMWIFVSLSDGFIWLWMSYFLRLYAAILTSMQELLEKLNAKLGLHDAEVSSKSAGADTIDCDTGQMILAHVMQSYRMTTKLITVFSQLFGPIVIAETGVCVGYLLSYSSCSITAFIGGYYNFAIGVTFWVCVFVARIFLLGTDASNMTAASVEMAKELLVASQGRRCFGEDLSYQANTLGMQIMIRPVEFAPGNFFTVDRRLVMTIFSTVTTYLIILMQFRQAEQL